MGTPAFAIPALDALIDAGHEVAGVFTRPDTRAGRGRRMRPPPVKAFAVERGLPVYQPRALRGNPSAVRQLGALAPDAIIVAAYGLFLPKDALDIPPLGCLNIHPSLLPRHRGASPVASAILAGDERSGATVMMLDEGMDTGPILAQLETLIEPDEDCERLTIRLFDMGTSLLVRALDDWAAGLIHPQPQDESLATTTRRLEREDGRIDWRLPASELERRVRAFTPWPGSFTAWDGRTLKIISARTADDVDAAGVGAGAVERLADGRIVVGAGAGALELGAIQLEGRRRAAAAEFARGYRDFIGATLGA